MARVIINQSYGGFDLTAEMELAYIVRTKLSYGTELYYDVRLEENFLSRYIAREDIDLVAVVQEIIDRGDYTDLAIVDIAPGRKYRICNYDGRERVEYEDEIEWRVG